MKFNQLRDFVAVAENGSLRAAARSLGLAQPAITRSIRELEHSLSAQLFIREARGVRLTPIGQDFLVRAMIILGEVRRAREAISQQQDDVEGELVVGLSVAGHLGIFANILRSFQNRYPGVKLRIIEGLLPTLEADLRNGLVDLYVGPAPEEAQPADLNVVKLFDNHRVVIGRRGHPLAGAKTLRDLADASWLTTSITRDAADELNQVFAEHGLGAPRLVCQSQSALSVITVLINSDILAMMPVQLIESPIADGLLEEIKLDREFAAPPIMMMHRTGIGLTPAGEYFIHLVRRAAGLEGHSSDSNHLSIRQF
jgi:LysR family transcriptional regulator of abg operon